MLFAPLLAWRHVEGTQRRTACDFALVIKRLVDRYDPDAEKIVLVLDNLNPHTAARLYEAFAPQEARRLADKIAWHYTPKHGSWLDMAEIELGVLSRECLDRHLPDVDRLKSEVLAWEQARNNANRTVNWHFTTADESRCVTFSHGVLSLTYFRRFPCPDFLGHYSFKFLHAYLSTMKLPLSPYWKSLRRPKHNDCRWKRR